MYLLYAAEGDVSYSLAAAPDFLDGAPGATFEVRYEGFDARSRAAFETAVAIWSRTISSPVPIRIRASWVPLGPGLLGRAGPTASCQSPRDLTSVYYPAALFDRLHAGESCAADAGETAEIEVEFNSDITSWDFGASGTGAVGRYSFVSAALHEIGHGLGFGGMPTSTAARLSPAGESPRRSVFDRFVAVGDRMAVPGCIPSLDPRASAEPAFTGPATTAANTGVAPRLELDAAGGEHAHFDDVAYSGTPNGLMTPALNSREVYLDVGPMVRTVLRDIGWVATADLPGPTVPISPSGVIWTTTPEYVWTAAPNATSYQFTVGVRWGGCGIGYIATYSAASLCSGGTCRLASPITLPVNDEYVWTVLPINAEGASTYAGMTFYVTAPTPPTLLGPSGTNAAIRPTYRWSAGSDSTQFLLNLQQNGSSIVSQTYSRQQICNTAGECAVTHALVLSEATAYTARVQAVGTGLWSNTVAFTTGTLPAPPTLAGPTTAATTPAPTYTWNASGASTIYALWVQRNGSAAPVIHTNYDATAICGGGTCRVTPRTELPDGVYTWWVLPTSPVGTGDWSSPASFSVTATVPPSAPPGWPSAGIIGSGRPTYRWTRVPNATWYYLWVDRGGAPLIQTWYFGADVCGETVCSVTPSTGLSPGGTYRWFVQTWSTRGYGPWSAATTFSIATTRPAVATLVSPTGVGATATPTYTWNRTPGASWYYLWVSSASGAIIQTWYRVEDVCSAASATCSATPALPLATGPYWFWIQTYNDHGYGPWSAGNSFNR